jgi:GrpB-like predicted nucleotidyltransferase (UPF0157 family)
MLELLPYNDDWVRLFGEEEARTRAAVSEYVLDIQHVGSTSMPGMAAKPILDIGVAVCSFEEARRCIKPLEKLGYLYRGEHGIARRHYFVKGKPRSHHLHMVEVDSENWKSLVIIPGPPEAESRACRTTPFVEAAPCPAVQKRREGISRGQSCLHSEGFE